LTVDNANAANRAITNGLLICNRKCQVEQTRREPTRCLKCQGWNHFAKDCAEDKDTCGNCAGSHRTSSCAVNERACASCKTKDHASWSRTCPTFTRKLAEYNNRNPDNSLHYFPTADVWTWLTVDKPPPVATATAPALPMAAQGRPSKTQLAKKPQQYRTQHDTYIPDDIYIPDYDIQHPVLDFTDAGRWNNNPGPSRTRPPAKATTSTQSPGTSNNSANSNENPYTSYV
jgi:hypothetical protein